MLVVPGLGLGWLLARRQFRGKALVSSLVHLPLVIPPVATGYLLLLLLGVNGPVGRWLHETFGLRLAFHWTGAAVASAVVALPLLVRSVRLAMSSVDVRLEAAARTLGSGRFYTFLTVTLPLAWPGLLAGCVLAFARSLGEFGATITFAGNLAGQTRTLPLAAYSHMQTPGGENATMQLVVISVVLSTVSVLAIEWLGERFGKAGKGAAT
jgi:molybdate transport system permease protein